jgi:putative NIF3 family GTP cyclohydrolase 1 type 2
MLTVQQVIDTILESIPGAPFAETVDTLKTGHSEQPVTGIVTTFLASQAVLERAVDLGANFIITHEPTFYNHQDATDWLRDDPVYAVKRRYIDAHHLAIWRFHDYWHAHQPDGILTGVLRALGWADYVDREQPYIVRLSPILLHEIVKRLKNHLGAQTVRVMGDPEMPCRKIALLVGAPGGQWQMGALRGDIDVLVTGEINEWETCEYVRDAQAQGIDKALVILGHNLSEEAGMAYLVDWLSERFPDLPITHVPTGDPFRFA